MSYGPIVSNLICSFLLAAFVLYRYGNWFRHRIIVTLVVLLAWYFSLLIIFILPLDVMSVSLPHRFILYIIFLILYFRRCLGNVYKTIFILIIQMITRLHHLRPLVKNLGVMFLIKYFLVFGELFIGRRNVLHGMYFDFVYDFEFIIFAIS